MALSFQSEVGHKSFVNLLEKTIQSFRLMDYDSCTENNEDSFDIVRPNFQNLDIFLSDLRKNFIEKRYHISGMICNRVDYLQCL